MEEWRGLTGAAGADHHEAVVQVGDLVQLNHLLHPGCALLSALSTDKLLLDTDLGNLRLKTFHLVPLVVNSREHIV